MGQREGEREGVKTRREEGATAMAPGGGGCWVILRASSYSLDPPL